MSAPLILYDNLADDTGAILTASSTAAGYDVNNVKDRKLFTSWKSTGGATEWIKIDMGAASTRYVDSFAISAHNLKSAGNITIAVGYSDDDVTYSDIYPAATPYHMVRNQTMVWDQITWSSSTNGHRYWRMQFTDCTSAIQIGAICVGRALVFPDYMQDGFDPDSFSLVNRNHRARGGQLVGAITEYVSQHIELKIGPDLYGANWYDVVGAPSWDDFIRNHWSKAKPFWFRSGLESTSVAGGQSSISRFGWYCWAGDKSKSASPYKSSKYRAWKFGMEALVEF